MYPSLWNGPGNIRGLALILNYEFTKQPDERTGSEKDVESLTKVLKALGYDVRAHSNLSHAETESELELFTRNPIHETETTDSTVVVAMSHGTAGNEWTGSTFQTEDRKTIASQPVVDRFQTVPGLQGKPKIFFFNFCRGPLDENPDNRKLNENERNAFLGIETRFWLNEDAVNETLLPNKEDRPYEDTMIVYSTLPRFVSYRASSGSIFIQTLCDVLGNASQVARKPLSALLLEVDKLMAEEYAVQTPETLIRGFNKEFYFFSFYKLRKYYVENVCRVMPLPWYPDRSWSIDEIFTELTIDHGTVTFPLEELFQHARDRFVRGGSYRIVIEGDPGYGKTTTLLKLASDWAGESSCNNYMSQFRLILFVKLGLIDKDNIDEHVTDLYQDELEVPVQPLLKGKERAQVLVLLDGYDEASENTKKIVAKVMQNRLWSQCHVVLTSRFGHVSAAIKANALCTTLQGFQETQVALAVGKFFVKAGYLSQEDVVANSFDKVTLTDLKHVRPAKLLPESKRITPDLYRAFLQNITESEPYKKLAGCPLLCAMFCCLVGEFPDRELPSTLTELYFAVINRNLYRAHCKQAEIDEEDVEEWNWSTLRRAFRQISEGYLKEFGACCLNYFKQGWTCFTLFELIGNSETCKPNDPRVVRLIEAGVLIKSTESLPNTTYHPTHRTMAEFLAAYYLTAEKDAEAVTRHLLEFCVGVSFMEVCNFCLEMQHGKIVVDAFRDIKLPHDCLNFLGSNKSLNNQKFWSEVRQVLPGCLWLDHLEPFFHRILQDHPRLLSVKVTNSDLEGLRDVTFVEYIFRLVQRHLDVDLSRRYLVVSKPNHHNSHPTIEVTFTFSALELQNLTVLFQKLVDSRVQLGTVHLNCLEESEDDFSDDGITDDENSDCNASDDELSGYTDADFVICDSKDTYGKKSSSENKEWTGSGGILNPAKFEPHHNSGIIEGFKLLLKSTSCPEMLQIDLNDRKWLLTITEALKDPTDYCKLKKITIVYERGAGYWDRVATEELIHVLTQHWLPKHLQELDLTFSGSSDVLYPIITRLGSFTCLMRLRLDDVQLEGEASYHFIIGILGSQLEKLTLSNARLTFKDYADLPKFAATCRLNSFIVTDTTIEVEDAHRFDWGEKHIFLEELFIHDCRFPPQLLECLGPSLRGVRHLGLSPMTVVSSSREYSTNSSTLQLFDAITSNNWNTLQELNLSKVTLDEHGMLPENVKRAILRCTKLDSLYLETHKQHDLAMEMNRLGISEEWISSDNSPLLHELTDLLRSLELKEFFLPQTIVDNRERRTFCEALAHLAHKWPGKDAVTGSEANTSLTLKKFSLNWAALAVLVFHEKQLDYRILYVEKETYEIWFPVTSESPSCKKRKLGF